MKRVLTIVSALTIITVLFSSCLTTKERIAMEEFKKQLDVAPAELPEAGPLYTTAAATAGTITAKAELTPEPAVKKVETKPAAIAKQEEPYIIQPLIKEVAKETTSKKNTNWLIGVLIFLLGMGIIVLIVFLMKKRKEIIKKEDGRDFKEDVFMPVKETKEHVIEQEKRIIEEKTGEQIEKPGPETKQPELIQEQEEPTQTIEKFEEEMGVEGPVINKPGEIAFMPEKPEAGPPKQNTGSGKARISPVQLSAGSAENTIHIIYSVGEDSPEYRTLKITVPESWAAPSGVAQDDGYITADVKGGKLISKAAEGRIITVTAYGLAAITGEIIVTYGDRCEGGKGITIPDITGTASFIVETEVEASKEIKPLEDIPTVDIIP